MPDKPIRDVVIGDRTPTGQTYISDPAEQPDGTWSIVMRQPSGRRLVVDFPNGDANSGVATVYDPDAA